MACLGEIARKSRFTLGSAFSNAGVVTVSELVGSCHCQCQYMRQSVTYLSRHCKAQTSRRLQLAAATGTGNLSKRVHTVEGGDVIEIEVRWNANKVGRCRVEVVRNGAFGAVLEAEAGQYMVS